MRAGTTPAAGLSLVSRQYSGLDDLAQMQALLRVGRRVADATTTWNPGDLEWWIASADPQIDWSERISLWSTSDDPGNVIAWTWWTPPDELDWFVDPSVDSDDLRDAILIALDRPVTTIWATVESASLARFLEERGYRRSDDGFIDLTCPLDVDDDRLPSPPPGFSVRSVELPPDLEERVRVHRAAFAPSKMTVEKHRRVAQMPSYRPELDVVAVAPDGRFASFCICWLDEETGTVEFEPVGTDPEFQRRGLASAVMSEAMSRAARLGASVAFVTSPAGDKGARGTALYQSLGFRQVREHVPFRKPA